MTGLICLRKHCKEFFATLFQTSHIAEHHLSKNLNSASEPKGQNHREVERGNEVGKLSLKNQSERLYNFVTKRGKLAKLVIAIVTLVFLSGIFSGFMLASVRSNYQTSSTFSSVGVMKTVGIGAYWDSGLTNRVSSVDWGLLERGTQKTVTVFMRNEGNSPITLSLSTSNWNPTAASSYLALTWNYNGQTINLGASVQVTLTLTVSASIAGINSFSFDIIALGTG